MRQSFANLQQLYFQSTKKSISGKIIVIGASAVDYQYRAKPSIKYELYKSCKSTSRKSFGGMARNIAESCAKMNSQTVLITALGNDTESQGLRNNLQKLKIQLKEINCPNHSVAKYLAIMDDKNDELLGISDMEINSNLTFENIYKAFFKNYEKERKPNSKDIVIIDANVDEGDADNYQSLYSLIQYCRQHNYYTIFEGKGQKSTKIVYKHAYEDVSLIKINQRQKIDILSELRKQNIIIENQSEWICENFGKNNPNDEPKAIITNSEKDVKLYFSNKTVKSIAVFPSQNIIKTTGAGDTLTGVYASMLLKDFSYQFAIKYGLMASKFTIQSEALESSISNKINLELIQKQCEKHLSKEINQ